MPPQWKYFAPQSFKNSNFFRYKLPSNPRTAGSGPRKVRRWGGHARNIFVDDLYSPSFAAVSPASPPKKNQPLATPLTPAIHYRRIPTTTSPDYPSRTGASPPHFTVEPAAPSQSQSTVSALSRQDSLLRHPSPHI